MKIIKRHSLVLIVILSGLFISGCATTTGKAFETSDSQVKLRSMQTRAFDTTDKKKMMQTVISTMQDLDFVIDKADAILGSITGSKFLGNSVVTMTVTVRPRGEKQLLVRANAQIGITSIEDAPTYQDFFTALEKAIFLTAQQVD
jgi:PBP1b-binding outer membrane lipoprotein LpoB